MANKPRKSSKKRSTAEKSTRKRARGNALPPAGGGDLSATHAEALATAVAEGEGTISASDGAELKVTVDVDTNHLTPYAIGWDGDLILDGVRPASAKVRVTAGHHVLSWSFLHKFEPKWHHQVSIALGAGQSQVVDSKSSQNGDDPNSAGTVIIDA